MPRPIIARTISTCECGGSMEWRKKLWGNWRQECLCGRCGPWRIRPQTRVVKLNKSGD